MRICLFQTGMSTELDYLSPFEFRENTPQGEPRSGRTRRHIRRTIIIDSRQNATVRI